MAYNNSRAGNLKFILINKDQHILSNQPYKAILFDLEGTLVDFQWNLKAAVKEIIPALKQFGIDPKNYGQNPDYAKLFNTTHRIAKNLSPQIACNLLNRLNNIYDTYDKDALSRWQPYPDTKRTLEQISKAGFIMGVVSNCGAFAANKILEKFNLYSYFKRIITRNDVAFIKPEPDGLIKASLYLDIPVQKILFVGDSLNDILPANKINMPSCFLYGGESRITGIKDHQATHEISSLFDILKLFASK